MTWYLVTDHWSTFLLFERQLQLCFSCIPFLQGLFWSVQILLLLFFNCSRQCITWLLQELPTHGVFPVPACGASFLPACCAAQREVLSPPATSSASWPPYPSVHLHTLQPPGALTHPQNFHTPAAVCLSLQSLGAECPPCPQTDLCSGTHRVLIVQRRQKAYLHDAQAAEHRGHARPLQPAPQWDVRGTGTGTPCPGPTPVSALPPPFHQTQELLYTQRHWSDCLSTLWDMAKRTYQLYC